jgi:hypothetical protein
MDDDNEGTYYRALPEVPEDVVTWIIEHVVPELVKPEVWEDLYTLIDDEIDRLERANLRSRDW